LSSSLSLLSNLDREMTSVTPNCNGFLCWFRRSEVNKRNYRRVCVCALLRPRSSAQTFINNSACWPWNGPNTLPYLLATTEFRTHRLRTPPRSDAFRHSGGERRRCTSPTVTLYLDVELSSERRPGTLQNTSEGADAPDSTMSLLFSLFRGFIPAHMRKKHTVLSVPVLKRDNLQDLSVNGEKSNIWNWFWRNCLGTRTGLIWLRVQRSGGIL
jgi:hypothetical protein